MAVAYGRIAIKAAQAAAEGLYRLRPITALNPVI